jgi:N-acyl-D-amino-acid deacylase
MHDLVFRGATLVDGTGAPPVEGDLAVDGAHIAAVGGRQHGRREIDARGLLLTPGFIDPHTHYDGQATWDPELSPSGWHGVTTALFGNCGVGFAPVRAQDRDWLVQTMEGVEDIPGTALHEGIRWRWESFPEYLDALEQLPRQLDIGVSVPHAPVRGYVMGPRGAEDVEATPAEIAQMAAIVRDGVRAGAFGFTTSRTSLHKTAEGKLMAGSTAAVAELQAIAEALRDAGHGVFGIADEHGLVPQDLPWVRTLARTTGRPVVVNLSQTDFGPEVYQTVLRGLTTCDEPVYGMAAGRAIGILMHLRTTAHPFALHPSFQALPADWPERLAALRDPEVRRRILADDNPKDVGMFEYFVTRAFHKMYVFDGDYEPSADQNVAALAQATGKTPLEVVYDALLRDDGNGFLYFPLFNYTGGDLSAVDTLHAHPKVVWGLSDAGAHCGAICDGGIPTWLITHWTRDRTRGPRWPLERAIHQLTAMPARLYGLTDRGVLAPGARADLNLIDYATLGVGAPSVAFDLPAGGRRLVQRARGYRGTWLAGVQTVADDAATGARPGRLIRAGR